MTNSSQYKLALTHAGAGLEAQAGEIILLTGDVGSGKSVWLKRMAALVDLPTGINFSLEAADPVVRMLFDRWPSIWLGQSIEEELKFGLKHSVSEQQQHDILLQWELKDLSLTIEPHSLNRLQSIRLALASMALAKPDLILLDNPSAALPEQIAIDLSEQIADCFKASNTVVVVASNRWHDWRNVATQRWHVSSADTLPEIV